MTAATALAALRAEVEELRGIQQSLGDDRSDEGRDGAETAWAKAGVLGEVLGLIGRAEDAEAGR